MGDAPVVSFCSHLAQQGQQLEQSLVHPPKGEAAATALFRPPSFFCLMHSLPFASAMNCATQHHLPCHPCLTLLTLPSPLSMHWQLALA